jgi:hypothetical protein
MPAILAVKEADIERTCFEASLGKKFETLLQPIKAECCGKLLSSQLGRKH